jgi:hypothetical protein
MTDNKHRPKPRPLPHEPENSKKKKKKHDDNRLPDWVLYLLVLAITAVWVASFVTGLFNPRYQPPEQVNLLFSSMVGGLLLHTATRNKGDDD